MSIGSLDARESRLQDAARRRGLVVSKAQTDKQRGRYVIVGGDVKVIKASHNNEFPYSFSLEEAEVYVARWV
jgi:hypothetical protein